MAAACKRSHQHLLQQADALQDSTPAASPAFLHWLFPSTAHIHILTIALLHITRVVKVP
jgi:hypothetical protein